VDIRRAIAVGPAERDRGVFFAIRTAGRGVQQPATGFPGPLPVQIDSLLKPTVIRLPEVQVKGIAIFPEF
jgi:hypothetical protein